MSSRFSCQRYKESLSMRLQRDRRMCTDRARGVNEHPLSSVLPEHYIRRSWQRFWQTVGMLEDQHIN